MTLTLQREVPLAEQPVQADKVFFVLVRSNGHWSPGAKIVGVYATEAVAELHAAQQKKLHPHQVFGVAALCSEAHEVKDPIEIVRAT
jgi:hypothetical protein